MGGDHVLDAVASSNEAALPTVDAVLGDVLELCILNSSADFVVAVFESQGTVFKRASDDDPFSISVSLAFRSE